MRGLSAGATWRFVKTCNSQSATASCTPICITCQSKCWKRAENKDWPGWIEYVGPRLYFKNLGPFSYTSIYFVVVMRRVSRQTICSADAGFLKAVVDGAYYPRLFVAISSGFTMAVNQWVMLHARVSCSTALDKSLMRRLPVIFGLPSQAGNRIFSSTGLESMNVISRPRFFAYCGDVSSAVYTTFMGCFSLLKSDFLGDDSPLFSYVGITFTSPAALRRYCTSRLTL